MFAHTVIMTFIIKLSNDSFLVTFLTVFVDKEFIFKSCIISKFQYFNYVMIVNIFFANNIGLMSMTAS